MTNVSWPEAIVSCVFIICVTFGVLRYLGKI
jgi:hypothetical protein